MRSVVVVLTALLAVSFLSGCGVAGVLRAADAQPDSNPPLARALDSSSARLTVITCATTGAQADELVKILDSLSTQSPLVSARGAASASVTINVCGGGIDPTMLTQIIRQRGVARSAEPR